MFINEMISVIVRKTNRSNLSPIICNLIDLRPQLIRSEANCRHFCCKFTANSLNTQSDTKLLLKPRLKTLSSKIIVRHLWGKKPLIGGQTKEGVRTKDVTLASRLFKEIPDKHKEQFLQVLDNFENHKFVKRQGYVEFITAALPYLKEFGVERDLEVYKALMNVFPKGKLRPDNIFAAGFFHYPLEQAAAVQILCKMEEHGVLPDRELENLIIDIFTKYSHPWRKCGRMTYWMTKFYNASPFPLPDPLPYDALELALLAIKRMCIDVQTKISVYSTAQVEDSIDKTWIVSGQSPQQQQIVEELANNETVYVEGPFKCWLRMMSIEYFMLRANNPNPVYNKDGEDDDELNDVSSIPLSTFGKEDKDRVLSPTKNLHIQDDGKILALCATGTSSRDSALSWVRILQSSNPKLKSLPVVFTNKGAPPSDKTEVIVTEDHSQSVKN